MSRLKQRHSVVILTSVVPDGLREMLDGILSYAQDTGHWRIYQQENRRWMYQFRNWREWGCDGIVAADHHSDREARQIAATGLPTVVLLQPKAMRTKGYALFGRPCCAWDSKAVGRMAAEYFIGRHYVRFAFVGDVHRDTYWSLEREAGFCERLAESGLKDVKCYAAGGEHERGDWMAERPRMIKWLKTLPTNTAVFTCNDRRGKQVLDACDAARIKVPHTLAVLGVDDDLYVCEASMPTLSSVRCDTFSAGKQIAEHLDAMMSGKNPPAKEFPVEPVRVVTRQSTDWVAVTDVKVAGMLLDIERGANDARLNVPRIVRRAGLSRRAAEMRFKNVTGATIREEIERCRMQLLKADLRDGSIPIGVVSSRCGFKSLSHMGRMFHERFGISPAAYRAQLRDR